MREAYVHTAMVELDLDGDPAAPGGAITVELCGHWEHEGVCRWPHQTAVEATAPGRVVVRTVFASESADEPAARDRIVRALLRCELVGPQGLRRWAVLSQSPAEPTPDEADFAARQSDPPVD